jgi:putative nucleotidyltransferase with HDIG domain
MTKLDILDTEELIIKISELKNLINIDQNPKYHQEGNVLNHTRLVIKALKKEKKYQTLSNSDQKILVYAALFHDIGKKLTTIGKNETLSSPKHTIKGASLTREILLKNFYQELNFFEREEIVWLVRHHGFPIWFLEKKDPLKPTLRISLRLRINLLYLLAKADAKGRIQNQQDNLLKKIDLFKEFAKENNCFYKEYKFPSSFSRFMYFRKDNAYVKHNWFNENQFKVFLMSGLPGSGKDTYIKKNLSQYPVISLDEIRKKIKISATENQGPVIALAKEKAKEYLRKKTSFIWNATNFSINLRQKLIDLFTNYKAETHLIYIEPKFDKLLRQNQKRKNQVPLEVLNKMIKKLQVPDKAEAPEVKYIVN